MDAKFNTPTQQRDSVKSTLVVTVKQTPNTPGLGGRDHFGVEFYSKAFKFVGHVDGGPESCTTRATTYYPERGTDTYVDCAVTPGAATKNDSFFFAVKPDAPLGTTNVYVHANYGNVDNAILTTTQIVAARAQCSAADFNFRGFCVPNNFTLLIDDLKRLQNINQLSAREKVKLALDFGSPVVKDELKRLAADHLRGGAKSVNFISTVIETFLANQGHAS